MRVRTATDGDSAGVIALIARIYEEYPGCVLDVDREEPGLKTPASSYDRFWVVDHEGSVGACIACSVGEKIVELKKLYVDKPLRRQGLGRRLVALVEDTAREHGIKTIDLWSDTRFTLAHALYEGLGYERQPETRDLHDLSHTTEYHFVKCLAEGV